MNNFSPSFKNPSVMNHDFSRVPHADIERSTFNRDHGYKTTFDAGLLIPIFFDEALPGDTFNLRLSSVARLNTLLYPLMDNMHMDFFFFSVPNRLLWNNWQKFMGEREDPGDSIDYVVPTLDLSSDSLSDVDDLGSYFGLPSNLTGISVNAFHFRAANLIWNEWFRDENLQNSLTVPKDDGPDDPYLYTLQSRGKRHDYFTSCLPWPQKGDAVDLPLGTIAPVITGSDRTFDTAETGLRMWAPSSGSYYGSNVGVGINSTTGQVVTEGSTATQGGELAPSNLWADLSNALAPTINSLREAFQLQRLLERDARGGTRYTELLKAHFGVTSPDSRLQRPEYLGGGSVPVTVNPVPRTASETAGNPVGELTGLGYCNQNHIGFTKSFTEHCTLLGFVSVRADLTYQQGINRMWSRQTRYDYYFPSLAHLGEQAVLNKEIYAQGTSADDDVFGYNEVWSEYRYKPSLVTGALNSTYATPLDAWHLAQEFGSLPVLNSSFIVENPPIDRVVAVPSEPDFIFDGYFSLKCTRPMPMYSVPGMIDHF